VAKSGTQANERGFTCQREDNEVGLIYMGARYYDPMTGRFISPDTIVPDPANPQSLNRYAYCMNNPVAYVDPSGHAPVAVAVFSSYMASTAAIAAKTMWVAYVAWAGAGLTAVGYYTNSPELAAVGSVMLGFTGGWSIPGAGGLAGGILGASVSLAISPLSPLDPGLKQAIGWALPLHQPLKVFAAGCLSLVVGPHQEAIVILVAFALIPRLFFEPSCRLFPIYIRQSFRTLAPRGKEKPLG
jgi:RHS repeat-associated protein